MTEDSTVVCPDWDYLHEPILIQVDQGTVRVESGGRVE